PDLLPPGLPSKRQMVVPTSSAATCRFHMIQPVLEYQKKRSSGRRSLCSTHILECSSMMPPWPCTTALGSPVVPEEYTIHSGCSNGTSVSSRFAVAVSASRHGVRGTVSAGGVVPSLGIQTTARTVGSSPSSSATAALRSKRRPLLR